MLPLIIFLGAGKKHLNRPVRSGKCVPLTLGLGSPSIQLGVLPTDVWRDVDSGEDLQEDEI